MSSITLIATTRIGLELLVKNELRALGFEQLHVRPGHIQFSADVSDIPRVNLWLRTADRVRLKIGEFKAVTFEQLFDQTHDLPWEAWIPADGQFNVTGKSVKSTLYSIRSSQAIVKKAVAQRLLNKHQVDELPETGAAYTIQVSTLKDIVTLTIDTSGQGLNKRGYREASGEAPLKETLASALVQLSFWNPERHLLDPMCGSGTILIEAALLARNIAPGLRRRFAAEKWARVPAELWKEARVEAIQAIRPFENPQLTGYDVNPDVIEIAKMNAQKAGVGKDIRFEAKPLKNVWIDQQYGIVITNPPYGARMSDFQELNQLYIAFNKMFRKKKGWSVYVISADHKFPDYFKRAWPDRVRKLYNGPIEANYYQYYGEQPPKKVVAEKTA